jgi:hypothetical protein
MFYKLNNSLFKISIIAIFAIVLFACSDDDLEAPTIESDFKAQNDSTDWIATSDRSIWNNTNQNLTLIGTVKHPLYNQEEELFLVIPFDQLKTDQIINQFDATMQFIIGGDVIANSHIIDSTENNRIYIHFLDTINQRIAGNFEVTLKQDTFWAFNSPIKKFTNGSFNLNYRIIE